MKVNESGLRIAQLCLGVLVSLGSVSAQEPQMPNLEGTYTLRSPAPCVTIRKAIGDTVKGMLLYQGRASDRLRDANLPPPLTIVIAYTPTEVTITTDLAGPITTPADGTPVNATRYEDHFEISTRWQNGKLKRTFTKRDEGQRVNTYNLNGDGTLTMQVTVTASRLPQPLTYDLVYARTTEGNYAPYDKYPDCAKEFERRGRVIVKEATKTAIHEVKNKFNAIEEKVLKPPKGVLEPEVRGYDPQDIIDAVEAGKNKLIQGLDGDQFAGMRRHIQEACPIPTESELISRQSPSRLVTKRTKEFVLKTQLRFNNHEGSPRLVTRQRKDLVLKTQLRCYNDLRFNDPEFDLTITSDPPLADYEVFVGAKEMWTGTTNGVEKNAYPGRFKYKITKYGYKPIEGYELNLMRGGRHLHCILTSTTDSAPAHPCSLQ